MQIPTQTINKKRHQSAAAVQKNMSKKLFRNALLKCIHTHTQATVVLSLHITGYL